MKLFLGVLGLTAITIIFCLGIAILQSCNAEPMPTAKQPQLIDIEEEPYNPCKDPMLKYERGLEGKQRKKECGVS